MTGSIRNFENKNFTPTLRIFVSLKVKLPDMTDWPNRCNSERFLLTLCRVSLFLVVFLTTVVVVVLGTSIVVLFFFWIFSKMAVFDVSQKCDVTIRIFKI